MLNKLEVGDILFTFEKGSMISQAIYWFMSLFQKRKFPKLSHCAIYVGDDTLIEADFLMGVQFNKVSHYTSGSYSVWQGRYKDEDVYGSLNKLQKNRLHFYLLEQLGKPYSFKQLFGIILHRLTGLMVYDDFDREAMICSELIAEAYVKCGCRLIRITAPFASPADLFNSRSLKKRRLI